MKSRVVVVLALIMATGASAQSTVCNTFGRTTYCDTTQPPNYSGMQSSMSAFGAALGAKIRSKREQESAEKANAAKLACLSQTGEPVMRTYQDCVERNAVQFSSSGESASTAYDAAIGMCRTQEADLRAVLDKCGSPEIYGRVMEMSRQDALAKVLSAKRLPGQ